MSSKSNRANLHLLNIGCYNIANKQCVIHETPNPQSMPVDWGFFWCIGISKQDQSLSNQYLNRDIITPTIIGAIKNSNNVLNMISPPSMLYAQKWLGDNVIITIN